LDGNDENHEGAVSLMKEKNITSVPLSSVIAGEEAELMGT
jgi:hypothetical protein